MELGQAQLQLWKGACRVLREDEVLVEVARVTVPNVHFFRNPFLRKMQPVRVVQSGTPMDRDPNLVIADIKQNYHRGRQPDYTVVISSVVPKPKEAAQLPLERYGPN